MRKTIGAISILVIAFALASCNSSSGGDEIDVSLSEWDVETSGSASAGSVTFAATNDGGEAHEMVIVRADSPDDLPVDTDGAVIEDDLPEGAFIDEVEELEPGDSGSVTVDGLAAGTYVIFCNITETEDDGTVESHFQEGMRTTISIS